MNIPIPHLVLERKIAQMLMVGFRGIEIAGTSSIAVDLTERGLGGVVLFDVDVRTNRERNIASLEQLARLTQQLQSMSDLPLLIAIDQEGGRVARLKPAQGFPETVSHRWLGEQDCLAITRQKSATMAMSLAQCGVNLNFAPCVDLAINPLNPIIAARERSFSNEARRVIRHAIEFIKAHHAAGVFCTLKHFPGHGSSTMDSHLGFVDVTQTWQPDELKPYEKLIESGLVDVIMTAHVYNGKWDEHHPATLSERTISLLRHELGYNGVLITDDLQMRAITDQFGWEIAVEKAIKAGVDILLFGNNSEYDEEIITKVIDRVLQLVRTGVISEDRIDSSFRRIWRLKSRLKV